MIEQDATPELALASSALFWMRAAEQDLDEEKMMLTVIKIPSRSFARKQTHSSSRSLTSSRIQMSKMARINAEIIEYFETRENSTDERVGTRAVGQTGPKDSRID